MRPPKSKVFHSRLGSKYTEDRNTFDREGLEKFRENRRKAGQQASLASKMAYLSNKLEGNGRSTSICFSYETEHRLMQSEKRQHKNKESISFAIPD